ncbi:MAG: PulJ/GspJ family protein [Thermoguttaceae bacterium]
MSRLSFVPHPWPRSCRKGFTLVEVLLSLGLAALVMMALATAIDVHLRCLEIGRTHVEEAQLARALLLRIEDDLRNAAVINPVDSTKIPAASTTPNAEAETPPDPLAEAATEDTASTTETESAEDEYVLGVYGETDWMQVDVVRAPRLDQYDYETLPSGSEALPDRVSGIKTVYYGLGPDTSLGPTAEDYRGGLMRREIDRALTLWADETGSLSSADQEMEPIAPEVANLEFLYYDGSQWVDSWDSTEMGGLPLAVHISLEIMPRKEFTRLTAGQDRSPNETQPTYNSIYSLTVALPVAEGDTSSDTSGTMGTEEEME